MSPQKKHYYIIFTMKANANLCDFYLKIVLRFERRKSKIICLCICSLRVILSRKMQNVLMTTFQIPNVLFRKKKNEKWVMGNFNFFCASYNENTKQLSRCYLSINFLENKYSVLSLFQKMLWSWYDFSKAQKHIESYDFLTILLKLVRNNLT